MGAVGKTDAGPQSPPPIQSIDCQTNSLSWRLDKLFPDTLLLDTLLMATLLLVHLLLVHLLMPDLA